MQDLTEFQELLLIAVKNTEPNAYNVAIAEELERLQNKFVSFGKLYLNLHKLREIGYIEIDRVEPGNIERGFRPRRYWKVTTQGFRKLDKPKERKFIFGFLGRAFGWA